MDYSVLAKMDNNDGPDDQFDESFEREIQDSTVWVYDGHFDQSWVSLSEEENQSNLRKSVPSFYTRVCVTHSDMRRQDVPSHTTVTHLSPSFTCLTTLSLVRMYSCRFHSLAALMQLISFATTQVRSMAVSKSTLFWVLSTGVGKLLKNSLVEANLEKRG
jgi:hypothetical protein